MHKVFRCRFILSFFFVRKIVCKLTLFDFVSLINFSTLYSQLPGLYAWSTHFLCFFFLLFWDFRDYLSKRFRFVYMYVLLTAVCMSVFFCFCYRPIIRANFTSERRVFFKELGATFCNICIYFLLYLFVGRWAHASSLRVADKSGSNG